jgi:hypothetical protein
MALADGTMVIACSAAWNGYRPMTTIDQTTHYLAAGDVRRRHRCSSGANRPQHQLGRVMLLGAADKRPVGMVARAYSML